MLPDQTDEDLYSVLGVSPEATSAAIRAAYFRAVRNHPPEQYPEAFERIRNAYEVLGSEDSRRSYDSMRRWGSEIEELVRVADEAVSEERWHDAIRSYRRALALNPALDDIRSNLATCLMNTSDYRKAAEAMEECVRRVPDSTDYWYGLGSVYDEWADNLEHGTPEQHSLYEKAREAFLRTAEQQPGNPVPYVSMAWTYVGEDDIPKAIGCFRKAIAADSKTDRFDLGTLAYICWAASVGDLEAEYQRALREIMAILEHDNDDDARNFVASELVDQALVLGRSRLFDDALRLARAAEQASPTDPELRQAIAQTIDDAEFGVEFDRVIKDESIASPVWILLVIGLCSEFEVDPGDLPNSEADARRSLGCWDPEELLETVHYVESEYPHIYSSSSDFICRIERDAAARLGTTMPSGTGVSRVAGETESSPDTSGGAITGAIIGGVIGSALGPLGAIIGAAIGGHLGSKKG